VYRIRLACLLAYILAWYSQSVLTRDHSGGEDGRMDGWMGGWMKGGGGEGG